MLSYGFEGFDRGRNDRSQVGFAQSKFAAPALHSAPVQQPIDEFLQTSTFTCQALDAFVFGYFIATSQRECLGKQANGRERRSELVRNLRHEVALQARKIRLATHENP